MKTGLLFFGMMLWFPTDQTLAQAGLKGEYYNGANFEQKVTTRVDPELNFTWKNRSPAPGVDRSYYSIRWTGKILAPVSGKYTFNAKVDDGIRLWVGNRIVMDVWQLNDSRDFTGSIDLEAGHYYDLKVEYFNAMLGGVIELFWKLPNAKKSFFSLSGDAGEPITAQYFRQAPVPVAAPPKPIPKPLVTASVLPKGDILGHYLPEKAKSVVAPVPPKPISKPPVVARASPVPRLLTVTPLPKKTPVPPSTRPIADSVVTTNRPVTKSGVTPEPKPGEAIVLQHVQFEQSSYRLLPESSVELDRLVETLRRNPQWRIGIVGHTDNVGDARLNQSLSEYRAKVVMSYLTRHGIADDRIEAKGYGGSKPITGNETEADRARNRRVEFTVK